MSKKYDGKLNFGKYAILEPVTHNFEQENDWYWTIRPATVKDEINIEQLILVNRRFIDGPNDENGNSIPIPIPPSVGEIALFEIAATFGGSNIPDPTDAKKKFLEDNASINDVLEALKVMPYTMIEELWKAVGQANPHLGPRQTNKKVDEKTDQMK